MALVAGAHGTRLWALAASGVALIGLVNVIVSFSLALWFALTSARGTDGNRFAAALMTLGIRRWLRGRTAPSQREVGAPAALEETASEEVVRETSADLPASEPRVA
jgi:hypothetical protein